MDKAERLLELMGSPVKRRQGNKIIACCPLAPWRHAGGRDDNPSFAVITDHKGSSFACLACGERGSLRHLYWLHGTLRGKPVKGGNALVYPDVEYREVPLSRTDYRVGGAAMGPALVKDPDWDQIKTTGGVQEGMYGAPKPPKVDRPPDAGTMDRWVGAPVPGYAIHREFEAAHVAWGLGHDQKSRRWVHPVRSETGELVGYTGRLYWEHAHCFRCGAMVESKNCPDCHQSYVKYKHHPGGWRKTALFGAHMVTPGNPVVLVEGTTDALRLWEYGVRDSCAMLGTFANLGQMQLLARLTQDVIVVGDGDEAGRTMNGNVTRALRSHVDVTTEAVELPEGLDPGDLTEEQARKMLPARCFKD